MTAQPLRIVQHYMGRLGGLLEGPAGRRRDNQRGGIVVAHIILEYQHRAGPALLMPEHGVQVGVVKLAPVEIVKSLFHMVSASFFWYVKGAAQRGKCRLQTAPQIS